MHEANQYVVDRLVEAEEAHREWLDSRGAKVEAWNKIPLLWRQAFRISDRGMWSIDLEECFFAKAHLECDLRVALNPKRREYRVPLEEFLAPREAIGDCARGGAKGKGWGWLMGELKAEGVMAVRYELWAESAEEEEWREVVSKQEHEDWRVMGKTVLGCLHALLRAELTREGAQGA